MHERTQMNGPKRSRNGQTASANGGCGFFSSSGGRGHQQWLQWCCFFCVLLTGPVWTRLVWTGVWHAGQYYICSTTSTRRALFSRPVRYYYFSFISGCGSVAEGDNHFPTKSLRPFPSNQCEWWAKLGPAGSSLCTAGRRVRTIELCFRSFGVDFFVWFVMLPTRASCYRLKLINILSSWSGSTTDPTPPVG